MKANQKPFFIAGGALALLAIFLLIFRKMKKTKEFQKLVPPVIGKITSKYGNRTHPITKTVTFHNGVDISVPVGTGVSAPENGTISDVYTHATGGLTLIMMSDTGVRYGFCHLKEVTASKGQKVQQYQGIAKSGNSGVTTGAHLHFTVKMGDTWIDPELRFSF